MWRGGGGRMAPRHLQWQAVRAWSGVALPCCGQPPSCSSSCPSRRKTAGGSGGFKLASSTWATPMACRRFSVPPLNWPRANFFGSYSRKACATRPQLQTHKQFLRAHSGHMSGVLCRRCGGRWVSKVCPPPWLQAILAVRCCGWTWLSQI